MKRTGRFFIIPILLTGVFFLSSCSTLLKFGSSGLDGDFAGSMEDYLVRIEWNIDQRSTLAGTGFYFFQRNTILTCAHNLPDNLKVMDEISFYSLGNEAKAEILFIDRENDLALLRAKDLFPGKPLAAAGSFHIGELVFAAGYPVHIAEYDGLYVTSGVVSTVIPASFDIYGRTYELLLSDVYTTTGNSGSPLLNSSGKVIGMIKAVKNAAPHGYMAATLFSPISAIEAIIDESVREQ